ncbi:sporulation integral membrane protein YlbJ [Halobacillus sp. A1]|uniref:sporulation integral membrane protein YlbJ n=1 Tax=Halobacillus sp. A1 TaxID=2880262 RepID=UPI0020A64ED1|nr:sporulation integral membrane protein YlbJ [Halobacillus sp. A1]
MIVLSYFKTSLFTISSLYLTISLIQMPDVAFEASTRGLNLWWTIVFPSLLPFFIIAELLFGLGVVHGVGILSEKIMKPLFNVPGAGGFVWVMGMASGYPAGAKWTVELRKRGQVTQTEAERLVAFTNASSPLFILSAVAVGFFGDPALGVFLAVAHYGGSLIVGICMRFYGFSDQGSNERSANFSFKQAFLAIHLARLEDKRPFGQLLGDAVIKSVQTLLLVGGFIILFSVLTGLLQGGILFSSASNILSLVQVPPDLQTPILTGMLEMTNGIGEITSSNASLVTQLSIVSFMLGFHGFSIQAQIASILADTDIRFTPYFIARIIHGCSAVLIMLMIFKWSSMSSRQAVKIFNEPSIYNYSYFDFMFVVGPILTMSAIVLALILEIKKIKQT